MSRADPWAGGTFLLVGILALAETRKLDYSGSYGAGAGFFPFWLATIIAFLGTILLVQSLWRSADGAEIPTVPTHWKKKALAYFALIGFILAIEFLGFVTAFTLLVAFLLLVIEGESWRGAIVTALAAGLGLYLFFVRLLDVKLPPGPLGF